MEEIPNRHFRPIGEDQRQRRAGDRKIIEKTSHRFCLLDRIKGDQQNIDSAKVKRKISPAKFPQQDQHQILCHLLQENVYAQHLQRKFPFVRRKPAIENAGGNTKNETRQKPKNMGQPKGLKTHAFRDMIIGYKKHIYHPWVL